VARVCDFASSLGRPVYIGLKKMKGLAPHPGLFLLRPLVSHSNGCVCVRGGLASLPLPERLPAICSPSCRRHAGVVSAQNWLTGELCVAVSPISWQRNLFFVRCARRCALLQLRLEYNETLRFGSFDPKTFVSNLVPIFANMYRSPESHLGSATDFGLWSVRVSEYVTTRKTQRRIHAGDRRSGRRSSVCPYVIRVVPGSLLPTVCLVIFSDKKKTNKNTIWSCGKSQ
jgi:hypothetical protein